VLPGYRAVTVSAATARADLGRLLARGADVQAVGAVGKGQLLRSEAFTYAAARNARNVARAWKRSERARTARIGRDGSLVVRRSGKRFVAIVVWREDNKVGLLRIAGNGRPTTTTLALQFARAADTALRNPVPTTAWDKVTAQIHPDGSVSRETALQAVAVAYGRLPGVAAPKGPRQFIDDGTLAATWILRFRTGLRPALRAAVDGLLGIAATGTRASPAAAADYGDPGFVPDPALQALAEAWIPVFAGHLNNHPLGLQVVVGRTSSVFGGTAAGGQAYADALDLRAFPGNRKVCRIRRGLSGDGGAYLKLAIAHEVFHCFQFDLAGSTAATAGAWVIEGMADWAAATVHPITANDGALDRYINWSGRPLFTRDYDAEGFWGHVQDVTHDLWSRIPQILNAGGGVAAYEAATRGVDFLSSWGSSVFRSIPDDPNWGMVSPPVAKLGLAKMPPASMTDITGTQVVYALPWTTAQYRVKADPDHPVISFQIAGPARLSDIENFTELKSAWFCTSSAPCTCPPGRAGAIPPTKSLEPDALLGLAAAAEITRGQVTYYSLDDFCAGKKPTGINGTWDGSYQSSQYPSTHGTFTVTFTQNGAKFAGTIHIRNSPCVTGGRLSGRINGDKISFGVVVAQKVINYAGTLSGNRMSGSYSAPTVAAGCNTDHGVWSASR
jgi:hypothetical protein